MSEDQALDEAAQQLLTDAAAIVARTGENTQSMQEVSRLLTALSASGVIDGTIASKMGAKPTVVEILGESPDGSSLHLYLMDGWEAPAVNHAHWHNYWQSIVVARGTWEDTVWRRVGDASGGVAGTVAIDRHEVIPEGQVQVLGPDEPHGWEAAEGRRADGVALLMWSGSARGKPRMDLDIVTGALSEEYGHLNPAPEQANG